jgi:hypothetical protein
MGLVPQEPATQQEVIPNGQGQETEAVLTAEPEATTGPVPIEARPVPGVIEAGQSKAQGPEEIASTPPASFKPPVTFIGFQENIKGRPPVALVNDETGSTVAYRPEEHELTNPEEYRQAVEGGETPTAKQPWEMRQRDYQLSRAKKAGGVPVLNANDRLAHREAVQQALAAGQPVPPEVLADYPDLTAPQEAGKSEVPKAEGTEGKPASIKGKAQVIDEESYLSQHGAGIQDFGEPALAKNIPYGKKRERWIKAQAQKDAELAERREALRTEYRQKVSERGKTADQTGKAYRHGARDGRQPSSRLRESFWSSKGLIGAERKKSNRRQSPPPSKPSSSSTAA